MDKILVRSNEEFEAVRFTGQKEIFGSPVIREDKVFEYSVSIFNYHIGIDIGDWVLKSINHSDMYGTAEYSSIPNKYFQQLYSEVKL